MQFEAGQLVKFNGPSRIDVGLGIYKGPSPKNKDRSLVYWLHTAHISDPSTELLETVDGGTKWI